jgi:hypothetical protein
MSLFNYVEVTFHGGPHDGTVSLAASELASNRTPMQSILAEICSSWRTAEREDSAFTGTILLLPAISSKQSFDRPVNDSQDAHARYRVHWVDLRDNGTLKLILKYLGTTDPEQPIPSR